MLNLIFWMWLSYAQGWCRVHCFRNPEGCGWLAKGLYDLWCELYIIFFSKFLFRSSQVSFLSAFAPWMIEIGSRAVSFSTENLPLFWDLSEVFSLSCSLVLFVSLALVPFWRLQVSFRSHEVFCESWCGLMDYVTRCLQCLAACSRTGWTRWSLPGLRSQERDFQHRIWMFCTLYS